MPFGEQFQRSVQKLFQPGPGASVTIPKQARSLAQEVEALRETNLELLETLGSIVDSLNTHTFYHSTQVAIYALALAQQMRLSEEEQIRIFKAALVHDVGMIVMSSAAVARHGDLTAEERDTLRLHPTIGGEIVARIKHLMDLAAIVHYHHEWYDGSGYPDRMQADEIPLGARIIALADSLDAMLTGRSNRPARSLQEAIGEVQSFSGSQFDPLVVDAFIILAQEKGPTFFCSSNHHANSDMLLTTLGIGEGRARRVFGGE